jgi:uncharacterized protein
MAHSGFSKRTTILISGLLLACAPVPMLRAEAAATSAQEPVTESQRNKQIVAAAFDRWAAGGADFFNEMLAPDVVWTIEGSSPAMADRIAIAMPGFFGWRAAGPSK